MSRPSFYLIDGHYWIYRSYFAPFRDLTSPTGEPVKATFVFTQTLLNLAEQRRPDYLAFVIDAGDDQDTSLFRKQLYPQYKANRAARPDDFGPQEARILQLVEDTGVPILKKVGFEADDVMATLAESLKERFDVYFVSKDKDLRQLLGEHVRMYDVQADEVTDPASLRARLGFGPEQAVEVQTLIGDPTDNVPGIPGVGEKTAAELVNKFGSVDGVYANLDQLKSKKKLVENLVAHRATLKLSRELVTLRRDVALPEFDAEACKFKGFQHDRLREHLEELGFRTLLDRIDTLAKQQTREQQRALVKAATAPAGLFDMGQAEAASSLESSEACAYDVVDTPEKLAAFVEQLKGVKQFAFDTETTSEKPVAADLVGLSFSWAGGCGHYVAVRGPQGQAALGEGVVLDALRPILEDPAVGKIGHNVKYDLVVMRRAGVDLRGIVGDTMLAAFLLDAGRMQYGIDSLALGLLNFRKIPTRDVIGTGKAQVTMDRVDVAKVARYAAEDADVTWRLHELLLPQLEGVPALRKLYRDVELPLVDVLADMELAGIRVDEDVLRAQSKVLGARIDELRALLFEKAGTEFNPDSPKQLADLLFNKLGLKPVKKNKTGFSTDLEVLEKLSTEHAVPALILENRQLVKLKNTYLDNLGEEVNPRTGRIHTSFNGTGAATGRLSSSDPNLQNIPIRTDVGRRIRLAFVPDRGQVLLAADYSQVELRFLAHFTREPALVRSFANDEDIHRAVAAEVFNVPLNEVTGEQRGSAKTVNFGIIYGVTAHGLARRIEGLSQAAAADLIKRYNERFPGIRRFMDECVDFARQHGYVQTLLGRRRPISEIDSRIVNLRNAAERVAINSVVQGSAADLIKLAMIEVRRKLAETRSPATLLLQVHDELVLECPPEAADATGALVKDAMQNAMTLDVPLRVDVHAGPNWGEAKG